ncbi:MAG: ABC transporter ATP-binding protein [Clostridiales bacterium]|nr:ABC transporter ATP-binding protein [Clostridiales bacterium]
MLKLVKYLKKSAGIIVVIIALLFLQAYCDLSLPSYTSDIINVGIQQGGIEDAVPSQIRDESLKQLFLFMTTKEQQVVQKHYEQKEDGIWELKDVTKDEREELNSIFAQPMMIALTLSADSEETKQMKEQMQLPEGVSILDAMMQMPQEQLDQMKGQMAEQIENMPEMMVDQASISYVKAEYEAQDMDLDQLQNNYMKITGVKMVAMALVIMLASVSVAFLSCRVAAGFARDVREDVYKKVVSFSNAEFNKFSTASLITRSTNDVQQIQLVMSMIFRIVLYAPILGIGGFMKVLNTNTSMAWIIGVAVGAILLVVLVLFAVAMPRFKRLQTLIDKMNLVTREILTGLSVIRAFSTEKHEEKRFEDANQTLTKTNLFVNRCMTFMMPTMMLIMNLITLLIVYVGAHSIDDGLMQVGDMMAFIQYTMQIIMSFLMLTMMSIMLPRASVSGTRISEVLHTPLTIHDPEKDKIKEESKESSVEFKHVSFAYPGASENVLTDLNFVAKHGETTAIIGSTGSGKSTLVNLIPRFFDVTEGQVLVNGVDVRDMKQHELRDKLGYVPQKGVLFSGTIDSNLRYGCEDASKETIQKAAEIAQATEFISAKTEGFDSPIAQGGTNVSGGQKQRLSIARAIAKNPEIYIFDDSFSALDYKTDVVLRQALKQETKDAVTIIVAQRISTILHAEQILVLDEGRIVGKGTHEELMKTCDVYRQIAMSQLSEKELGLGKEAGDHE